MRQPGIGRLTLSPLTAGMVINRQSHAATCWAFCLCRMGTDSSRIQINISIEKDYEVCIYQRDLMFFSVTSLLLRSRKHVGWKDTNSSFRENLRWFHSFQIVNNQTLIRDYLTRKLQGTPLHRVCTDSNKLQKHLPIPVYPVKLQCWQNQQKIFYIA